MTERYQALVRMAFVCRRRDGSVATVPAGPCTIEYGEHFAEIFWEAEDGTAQRADVPRDLMLELIKWGKVSTQHPPPP